MSQTCPTCGQPIPEPSAGQPAQTPAAPPPGPGLRRFATVKVAAIAAAVVVVAIGAYLLFGRSRPLAERLYAEDPATREAALTELATLETNTRAPVVEALVKNAADPDPRKRSCTLEALVRLKPPVDDARSVLPGLHALMGGPDSPAAMQAFAAARYIAPARQEVQAAALVVLSSQGVRLSSTAYLAVLATVSQTMSATGDAVPGLPVALGSVVLATPDAAVRTSALGVIGQLSSTAQAEAGTVVGLGAFSSTSILQGLQDPLPANQQALLGSLIRIIPKSVDLAAPLVLLARDPSPALRTAAVEVLMSLTPTSTTGWAAVTGLLKDASVDVRRATVLAVKPRAKELPRMAVTNLIALLKDPDEIVRGEAAAVLETMPSPRVKKALAAYASAKAAAEAPATEAAAAEPAAAEAAPDETAASPSATTETASTPPAAGGAASGEAPATEAAPAEAAPADVAPADAAPAKPAPDETIQTDPAEAAPASGEAAKPCGYTPEQATTLAKDHTPRSYADGACKDTLQYSVKKSDTAPCVFEVTVSCNGEALGTCEVDGDKGTYAWQ
ncbi:MAG: hypothetical protein AAB152_15750 [Candidatus Coatesbacteria bacterium]